MDDPSSAAPVSGDGTPVAAKPDAAVLEFPAVLFDRYRVQRELGRGGMGVVLLAMDEELGQLVAVKLIPDMVVRDTEAIADLKKEVLRGMALLHPNIVRTHHFERNATTAAIIMEYVEGDTLADLKTQQADCCFAPADVLPWLEQLCPVLDYAHLEAKIAHRDLKPRNLMLTPTGRLKVADFGIASQLSDSLSRVSERGNSSGTPPYMSPQQAMGERPSHLHDIYALGATIYELLTSKPPFFRGNILAQVLHATPPAMTARLRELDLKHPALPRVWEEVVTACLSKDPKQRPQSAGELLTWLKSGQRPPRAPEDRGAEEPGPADFSYQPRPQSGPVKAKPAALAPSIPPISRRPAKRWLGATIAVVILGLVLAVGIHHHQQKKPSEAPSVEIPISESSSVTADSRNLTQPPDLGSKEAAPSAPEPKPVSTPAPAPTALAPTPAPRAETAANPAFAGSWSGTRRTKLTVTLGIALAGGISRTQEGLTTQPVGVEISPDLSAVYWHQEAGTTQWSQAVYQNAPPQVGVEQDKANTQKLEPVDKVLGPFKPAVAGDSMTFQVSDPSGDPPGDEHRLITLTLASDGQTAQCRYGHLVHFSSSGMSGTLREEDTFSLVKAARAQLRPAEPVVLITPHPATPTPTAVTPEQLRFFCEKLQRDEQSRDLDRILANYMPRVTYEELGLVAQSVIRKDKLKYFERWPHTTSQIKDSPTITSSSSNTWTVDLHLEWTAENATDKRAGESEQSLTIMLSDQTLKVSQEKSKVTKKITNGVLSDTPGTAMDQSASAQLLHGKWRSTFVGNNGQLTATWTFGLNGQSATFESSKAEVLRPGQFWLAPLPASLRKYNSYSYTTRNTVKVLRRTETAITMQLSDLRLVAWEPQAVTRAEWLACMQKEGYHFGNHETDVLSVQSDGNLFFVDAPKIGLMQRLPDQ